MASWDFAWVTFKICSRADFLWSFCLYWVQECSSNLDFLNEWWEFNLEPVWKVSIFKTETFRKFSTSKCVRIEFQESCQETLVCYELPGTGHPEWSPEPLPNHKRWHPWMLPGPVRSTLISVSHSNLVRPPPHRTKPHPCSPCHGFRISHWGLTLTLGWKTFPLFFGSPIFWSYSFKGYKNVA